MRVVAYARFSSDNQREESIDAQLRAIYEYAHRHGMTIVDEYIDRAKTATSDKRPGFQQMITDAKGGDFQAIIVHKLDRFSRNRYDSAIYRNKLSQLNVRLYSVVENLDDSPESIIMEAMLEGMAEYYSKNLAREVRKGMMETALQCKSTGGKPPLGYRINPETRKYEIDEWEAGAVRLIYSMVIDGQGYIPIINALNQQGYRTKAGNSFSKTSLYQILVNEKYTGVYVFNRAEAADQKGVRNNHRSKSEDEIIRIPGGIPAIISKDDFDLVQSIMKARKNKNARINGTQNFLLTGKIVCGDCGSAYIGSSRVAGRNRQRYISYRCNKRHAKSKEACANKEVRREYIEAFVLKQLAEVLFNEEVRRTVLDSYNKYLIEEQTGKSSNVQNYRAELKTIIKKIDNLVEVIADGHSAAIMNKLAQLESRKDELEAMIHREQRMIENQTLEASEVERGFERAKQMLVDGTLEGTQRLINQYVDKVKVYQEHVEVSFNVLPLLWAEKKHNGMVFRHAVVLENGGGEGSRTPVPKPFHGMFSGRSRLLRTALPPCSPPRWQADTPTGRVRVMVHGTVNSFRTHGDC